MYSYIVFRGNSSNLVEDALARRPWWKSSVHNPNLDMESADMKKIKLQRKDEEIRQVFERQMFNFCWKSFTQVKLSVSPKTGQVKATTLHSVEPTPKYGRSDTEPSKRQMVNHFSNIEPLCTKNGLLRSLKGYYNSLKLHCFDATPTTFICTSAMNGESWNMFVKHFKSIAKKKMNLATMPWKQCLKNIWILKPTNSNQGRGIEVFKELTKIKSFLRGKPKDEEWIFQKYLESPLLLWGRKFDIRVWVAVTETFDIYIYNDGYLRTSSEPYTTDLDNTKNGGTMKNMIHLTNYCMQKNSPHVGKYEDGNTLSFMDFQRYLDQFHKEDNVDFRRDIFPKVKQLCVDAILSAHNELRNGNKGRHSAELFGFDFMVDSDYRVWLIEVNTNPFLGTQNQWHGKLVSDMIEGFTQLVVDPMFPPPKNTPVKMNTELVNDWKILYSKTTSFLEGTLLPTTKRLELGVYGWYYPRKVPKDVVFQNNGGQFEFLNAIPDVSRKQLSTRDRAAQEARKRVRKRNQDLKRDAKRKESIIEDAVKATKLLLTKQRQKERRERRIAFIKSRKDIKGGKVNTKPLHIAPTQGKEKMMRGKIVNSPVEVVESKTYEEKSDDLPVKKRSKNTLKNSNVGLKRKEVEIFPRVPQASIPLKLLSSLNENPKELLKSILITLRQILFPEKQTLMSDSKSNIEGGHPFIDDLYANGLHDGNKEQYRKTVDAINALEACPKSNSVLIFLAQHGVVELLWPFCGIERNVSFSSVMTSMLETSYISLLRRAKSILSDVSDFYRIQVHIRKQTKLPPLVQLAFRSVAFAALSKSCERDEIQLLSLRGILEECRKSKSKDQIHLIESYAFHTAVYILEADSHSTAKHISKQILDSMNDCTIDYVIMSIQKQNRLPETEERISTAISA